MRALLLIAALTATAPLALTLPAQAQWTLQQSPTTADLRGIDNVGQGIAWASGTNGTVLRTEDAGYLWQVCTIPPNAEHLDFRGIQAFDANTAIVMSSGPGDQSRLYKTTDGCQTWTLLFTNPDKDGFWDAILFLNAQMGWLLGDPVDGSFIQDAVYPNGPVFIPYMPRPSNWRQLAQFSHLEADGRGAFAASNTSLAWHAHGHAEGCIYSDRWFGTSGPHGAKVFRLETDASHDHPTTQIDNKGERPKCSDVISERWIAVDVPVVGDKENSGIFSLAPKDNLVLVAVGGGYLKPNDSTGTAAFTTDGGKTWQAATTPPHGFRSAVAYDSKTKTWITVGPNGTDISTDDGRNWRALRPAANEAPDADQHWNALSLPYAVGPHGRIGYLNPSAFQPLPSKP